MADTSGAKSIAMNSKKKRKTTRESNKNNKFLPNDATVTKKMKVKNLSIFFISY